MDFRLRYNPFRILNSPFQLNPSSECSPNTLSSFLFLRRLPPPLVLARPIHPSLRLLHFQSNFFALFFIYLQKWMYQIHWDPSINALFFNSEGKFFPQKILSLQQNQLLNRKFNFFSENVLVTKSTQSHIYTVGINGQVSKIPKKDICRLLVKQKEKIKNVQVQKVVKFKKDSQGHINIEKNQPQAGDENTQDESYVSSLLFQSINLQLFDDHESAIVGFEINPNKKAALHLRHSNIVFLI